MNEVFAHVYAVDGRSVMALMDLHLPLPPYGSLVCVGARRIHAIIADAKTKANKPSGASGLGTDHELREEDYFESNQVELTLLPLVGTYGISSGDLVELMRDTEIQEFSFDMRFIRTILELDWANTDDLLVNCIRRISNVYPDPDSFLLRVAEQVGRCLSKNVSRAEKIKARTRPHEHVARKPF